ncbi:hypothetical protein C8Q72DRAFT_309093 [Fomitopsis betulina]|nr:hypothetical protein C8Q72DRAFT_309093 [Fomitopsis betulina]
MRGRRPSISQIHQAETRVDSRRSCQPGRRGTRRRSQMILTLLSHPHLHLPTRSLRDSPKCKLVMRNLLSILYSRWLPTFALGNRPQRMQRTTPRRSPHLAVQPDYRGLMLSLQVRCLLQVLGFRRRHHGHQAAHLNRRARPHRHSDRSQCEAPHLILSRRMPRLQPSVQRILRNNQWLVLTAASRRVPALTVTGFCSCIRQA